MYKPRQEMDSAATAPEVYNTNAPEVVKSASLPQVLPVEQQFEKRGIEHNAHRNARTGFRKGIVALTAIIAVVIGLGAGVGIGWAARGSSNTGSSDNTPATTSTAPTPLISETPLPATPSFITAGYSGIADSLCAHNPSPSTYTSPVNNRRFTLDCGVDYPAGTDSIAAGEQVQDLYKGMVYSLEECMDLCVSWNFKQSPPCRAVSFFANISQVMGEDRLREDWGNCLFRTQRGLMGTVIGEEWVADSAYID